MYMFRDSFVWVAISLLVSVIVMRGLRITYMFWGTLFPEVTISHVCFANCNDKIASSDVFANLSSLVATSHGFFTICPALYNRIYCPNFAIWGFWATICGEFICFVRCTVCWNSKVNFT